MEATISQHTDYDLIVIGGGPAGMMAAGQAANRGASALLMEKMDQPGRKLLLTGKHRCNLTNVATVQQFLEHFNPQGAFLTQLFYRFFHEDLRAFFHELGVPTEVQRGDRVFPKSENARHVRDALLAWAEDSGVHVKTNTPVTDLTIKDNRIQAVQSTQRSYRTHRAIIATGGAAYPGTGSTGDGYTLARKAGHRIIPVRPALVPLITTGDTARQLQGLSLRNVRANLWVAGEKVDDLFGEMVFTHFGLSGPIILTLSRQVVDHLRAGKKVVLAIDLKPALDHPTLEERLLRDIEDKGRKQFSTLLEDLLPRKLVPVCVEQTGIPWDKKNNQLTSQERTRLRMWLKEEFRFQITDHRSFDQAIITAGGVNTREVDPHSMESKLIRGLYFAGEVLDVDGDTGGYNLQAAFSTGWAAGRAAASTLVDS